MKLRLPKSVNYFLCILLLTGFCGETFSQNFTNRGTDFWVGHMGHIDGTASSFKLYITSDVNTSGFVSIPLQSWSQPFTVTANAITIVQVPSVTGYVGCSDCIQQKGIHITANDDIAAYAHIYASARSDATLLLPTSILGKEYYATCFRQLTNGQRSQFMVVATEDSTLIEITPIANTTGGQLANVPFNITLQQGEVYQVQSATDLTGSKIIAISNNNETCKKIAVFAGSTFTELGCVGSGDNLFEQMYPPNTWGKNFITSPLKTRTGGDLFRVMALSSGTTVTINGVPHLLNQLEYHDTLLSVASYYSADKPIVLSQYARTQACDNKTGDPFMVMLTPVEQTVNNVLLYSSPEQNITGEYINVTMKTADIGTFLLDGGAVTFTPVAANPSYSYSQNTVSAGTHTLVADSGFNAIAYGFGSPESYGYLAGANAKVLPQQTITINPLPACKGSDIIFNGSSSNTPTSWKWYFGDSDTSILQNATHVYADTGTFVVSLVTIYPNGCEIGKDSTFYILHVNGGSSPNYTAPEVCLGNPILFTDSTTTEGGSINSWYWDFGDGDTSATQSPTHLYAACDTFNVKLVVQSTTGCRDSIIKTVVVNCLPVADFNAPPVCENEAMVFNDSSTGNVAVWNWNYGDSSPVDNIQSPSYTYTNPGNYIVTLNVTSTDGCIDSISKSVQVYYSPTANYTHTDVCYGDTVHFVNTSFVDTSTSIASYLWLFGDGTNSSLEHPVHFYASAGTYSVTLLATTIDSCSNAKTVSVNVYDAPQSLFIADNICLFDTLLLTNNTIPPSMGSIANWTWNFGDGSPINTIDWNPSHLYSNAGNYVVTLITYSSNLGCSDTLHDSITLFPMPLAGFTTTDVCLQQAIDFYDSSSVLSGTVDNWLWDFGDGSTLVAVQDTGYTYADAGAYLASLIVTTNNGCKDTATGNVVVHPLPVALYTANNVCAGNTVPFMNLSGIATNPTNDIIQSWSWDFGDNSVLDYNQNTSHLYPSYGSYDVQLLVVSDFGCADSINKIIVINPNPVANFIVSDTLGCEPLCVSFQNMSSGNIAFWLWEVGDASTTCSSQDFSYCYMNDSVYSPVSYTPSLTITTDSGCVGTLSKAHYITVYPHPDAQFSVQPAVTTIIDPEISIKDMSIGSEMWLWDFGDGQTASVYSPDPHVYADTGAYTVTLIVSTQYDCLDTSYQNVIIEPDFWVYIPNAFTPNDDGINDTFMAKGVFIKEFEMQIFDRWGNMVFISDNIDKPWDGKVSNGNEIAQQDVYIYSLKVVDFKMVKHNYKGLVTLLK